MPRILVRPRADFDVDEQAEYIARDSVAAARRFYEAVEKTFEQLANMPGMGSSWESRDPRYADLRVWPVHGFGKHLIFYRAISDGVEIVRVLHSARDIDSILGLK
jgi:toxin ParE1/3/4